MRHAAGAVAVATPVVATPVVAAPVVAVGGMPQSPFWVRTTAGKAFRIILAILNSILAMMCFIPIVTIELFIEISGHLNPVEFTGALAFLWTYCLVICIYLCFTLASTIMTAVALANEKSGLFWAAFALRLIELLYHTAAYIVCFVVWFLAGVAGGAFGYEEKRSDKLDFMSIHGDGLLSLIFQTMGSSGLSFLFVICAAIFAGLVACHDKPKQTMVAAPMVIAR